MADGVYHQAIRQTHDEQYGKDLDDTPGGLYPDIGASREKNIPYLTEYELNTRHTHIQTNHELGAGHEQA